VAKRLFLVRHCESTGQEPSASLTTVGRAQAVLLADHLATAGVDLLVSSPYTRAQQSIVPLAQRLGLTVETDTRLVERMLSAAPLVQWRTALRQTFADLDLVWPGGESSRTAMARGRAALDALLARPAHAPVVVTHGNLMTLLLHSFQPQFGFQTWENLSNPDVYRLAVHRERVEIVRTWVPPATTPSRSGGPHAGGRHEEAPQSTKTEARSGEIRCPYQVLGRTRAWS
jgi:2,3-bisphosphoglycerate-dependent phosphoglycerate mutase